MADQATSPTQKYTTGSVISKDGTTIGYRQYGNGSGVILVHGGMMASQNFMKLAVALSDTYTVYVPDRRGRGMSGPHGDNYCLARECEDIQALVNKTGAYNIFGLSSGAIIALYAANMLPSIRNIALYEPPLLMSNDRAHVWVTRYERELAQGRLGAAFVSVIKGTGDSDLMGMLPRFILVPLINYMIRADAKAAKENRVSIKSLIPTMHYDAMLVAETEGRPDNFKQLQTNTLLLGGSRSISYLKVALNALKATLRHSSSIEFPGIGHLAADNSGRPELVAQALKNFFG